MDGTGAATILRLEGRLTHAEVDELAATIDACRRERRRVVIDLAGLSFLDPPAATLLRAVQNDRVELAGATSFVADLLRDVAP